MGKILKSDEAFKSSSYLNWTIIGMAMKLLFHLCDVKSVLLLYLRHDKSLKIHKILLVKSRTLQILKVDLFFILA